MQVPEQFLCVTNLTPLKRLKVDVFSLSERLKSAHNLHGLFDYLVRIVAFSIFDDRFPFRPSSK
jgi:hypothetical protein